MDATVTGTQIEQFLREQLHSAENTLGEPLGGPAWGDALVGFSRGEDPLWGEIKASIGPFYWEPIEIFRTTFPDLSVEPGDLTVIAWVLPHTEATKEANRRETRLPSERWARARKFGEQFNVTLRKRLVGWLASQGIAAVAPQLSAHWAMHVSDRFGLASSWSERHAAHISGLGTFGLCDGLITPVGKAMRCGSVVAHLQLPATERPYTSHREYCPYFTDGSCGACMTRCPVGAITVEGHDKAVCQNYIDTQTAPYILREWGLPETYGCGLCQTKVPCETGIPKRGE